MSFFKNFIVYIINLVKYILEHLSRFIFIGLVFFLVCTMFIVFSKKVNIVNEPHINRQNITQEQVTEQNINENQIIGQNILLFGITLENWSTFLAIIGIIGTAFWALYQFDKGRSRSQQEKAAEIAQNFADDLVEKVSIISTVLLKIPEMKQLLSKISREKLKSFTVIEIEEITKDSQCFKKCSKIINSDETQQKYLDLLSKRHNESEIAKFDSCFPALVENTLNHLEAVCINISSQAAGSEYIYNSLHQSFLNFVEVLSIKISENNYNNIDKYFTNIIQVYNMWNAKKSKDISEYEKTERKVKKLRVKAEKKVDKLNSKVKKEITKLLEKKNKTV